MFVIHFSCFIMSHLMNILLLFFVIFIFSSRIASWSVSYAAEKPVEAKMTIAKTCSDMSPVTNLYLKLSLQAHCLRYQVPST